MNGNEQPSSHNSNDTVTDCNLSPFSNVDCIGLVPLCLNEYSLRICNTTDPQDYRFPDLQLLLSLQCHQLLSPEYGPPFISGQLPARSGLFYPW